MEDGMFEPVINRKQFRTMFSNRRKLIWKNIKEVKMYRGRDGRKLLRKMMIDDYKADLKKARLELK